MSVWNVYLRYTVNQDFDVFDTHRNLASNINSFRVVLFIGYWTCIYALHWVDLWLKLLSMWNFMKDMTVISALQPLARIICF